MQIKPLIIRVELQDVIVASDLVECPASINHVVWTHREDCDAALAVRILVRVRADIALRRCVPHLGVPNECHLLHKAAI